MLERPKTVSDGEIEHLLETPEEQRRKSNNGYDPLATLPEEYVSGEKDLPSTEKRWEEGHQYLMRQPLSDANGSGTLDFYVIEEMDIVDENYTKYGMIDECQDRWQDIVDEIYE